MKLFSDRTKEQQTNSLSAFYPAGSAFESANTEGSTFGDFTEGLSCEIKRVYDDLNDLSEDYDILLTDELLSRWEGAVGIPDDCFPGTGSKTDRRLHVLLKFAKMNVQTIDEFTEVIELLGFTVTLVPGADVGIFPVLFPVEFFSDTQQARFTLVVNLDSNNAVFALPFPVEFASSVNNIAICILDIIKPANVGLLLRFES